MITEKQALLHSLCLDLRLELEYLEQPEPEILELEILQLELLGHELIELEPELEPMNMNCSCYILNFVKGRKQRIYQYLQLQTSFQTDKKAVTGYGECT